MREERSQTISHARRPAAACAYSQHYRGRNACIIQQDKEPPVISHGFVEIRRARANKKAGGIREFQQASSSAPARAGARAKGAAGGYLNSQGEKRKKGETH
jgi:hypothetical protein